MAMSETLRSFCCMAPVKRKADCPLVVLYLNVGVVLLVQSLLRYPPRFPIAHGPIVIIDATCPHHPGHPEFGRVYKLKPITGVTDLTGRVPITERDSLSRS
jgi:hypothetical protein